MAKKLRLGCLILVVLLAVAAAGGYMWFKQGLEPMPEGKPFYIRFEEPKLLRSILGRLRREQVIRDPRAFRYYMMWKRVPDTVHEGTYQLAAGMTVDEVIQALQKPVQQTVRIREGHPAFRVAPFLEEKQVADAEEYLALVEQPEKFKDAVSFPLPADSLEGYLYPDTYDLPPLLGAEGVIRRQLQAFERKVYEQLEDPKNLKKLLTIASMVELEAGLDSERPVIAGVIRNRIAKNMRLQIDATVLYALKEWRGLTYEDYRTAPPPYNTYRVNGLPPGPICSPTWSSVSAALEPAKHDYLYYVLIEGTSKHAFAATYAEHLANIRRRNVRRAQGQ